MRDSDDASTPSLDRIGNRRSLSLGTPRRSERKVTRRRWASPRPPPTERCTTREMPFRSSWTRQYGQLGAAWSGLESLTLPPESALPHTWKLTDNNRTHAHARPDPERGADGSRDDVQGDAIHTERDQSPHWTEINVTIDAVESEAWPAREVEWLRAGLRERLRSRRETPMRGHTLHGVRRGMCSYWSMLGVARLTLG